MTVRSYSSELKGDAVNDYESNRHRTKKEPKTLVDQ